MKKLLAPLTIAALYLCCMTNTQAQISVGLKAGVNLANINYDGLEEEIDIKYLPTFHVGAIVELGLTENLGVGAGLMLTGKGFKVEEEFAGDTYKSTSNPMYVQVPVTLNYHNNGFFAGVGPYVGFGLFGKSKTTGGGQDDSYDLEFGSTEDDDYSALDFGAGLELGYQISAIRISASYNLGLANIIPSDIADGTDEKATHNAIGVSVAYIFGK